ncbi:hypothetical protein K7X08_029797 [Anisodus acutangulus]|uniref:Uncharacterized protein n=1 Tax=Anisodus acutangulus TaxID=402998 RepID=A0A9Q1MBZ9_9SOLA|nr:hypothetical protein K7X08_029797 [Anisodus acutangulus]
MYKCVSFGSERACILARRLRMGVDNSTTSSLSWRRLRFLGKAAKNNISEAQRFTIATVSVSAWRVDAALDKTSCLLSYFALFATISGGKMLPQNFALNEKLLLGS